MQKLDPNFKPGMTSVEVYLAGGDAWLIEQYKIIQRQIHEHEMEEEACDILV